MTDLAFIVDTSDAALPIGRAVTPVSVDSGGSGSFSRMLGERLQSGLAPQTQEGVAPPQAVISDTNPVGESGVSGPIDGKPLPLLPSQEEASSPDSVAAGLADAALLAAITQSAPHEATETAVALAASTTEIESDVNLLGPSYFAGNPLNTLGATVAVSQTETLTGQPKAATMLDAQLPTENVAKQLLSSQLKGVSADMQDARSNTNQMHTTTNLTSAMLAQPVSESAQRALAQAMNEVGLGKRVAPNNVGSTEVSQALTARQSGASPLPNGLTATMQLAAVTAKTASNAGFDASIAAARLAQQTGSSLNSVTPLVSTGSTDDVSGMLSMTPRSVTPVVGGAMPVMPVATPVGQAGWANELGQRVAWLAQGELREAQLQLHPRSLGPVEVRIAYGHEQQLNVSFSAANPVAREALDAALPRLREMFEQQGLNLADANISQQSFSDQRNRKSDEGEPNLNSGSWSSETEELTEQAMLSNTLQMGNGMLDAYA